MKDLIEELRERHDGLCKEAADQLELLQKKMMNLAAVTMLCKKIY